MADKSRFVKYFKIWWLTTSQVSQTALISRFGALLFILGKILRFAFFLIFLLILGAKTSRIAGFSIGEIIFFFATFQLVDTAAQIFLREVYRFRYYVTSGEFDYFLTKPISPLLRSLFGGADILDLPLLVVSVIFIIYSSSQLPNVDLFSAMLYIFLVVNGLIIALSLHILVLAIGVLTTEIDHTIWIYRDITQMGRLPVDIYKQPLSWILTYILPVAIMITIPAKALIGGVNLTILISAFIISLTFLAVSLKIWQFALKNYTSVSS